MQYHVIKERAAAAVAVAAAEAAAAAAAVVYETVSTSFFCVHPRTHTPGSHRGYALMR